ncbi:MAG: HAD family hydrolase, partial [Candidatus Micrarchaeota archaeon]
MLKAIVFDLDGVVYLGAHGIPGVAAEVYRLQKKVKVLFLTNNATKSRLEYVRHLAGFGINARISDVMTAACGCAHHIREKFGRGKTVFVIGEQGFRDELEIEADARLTEGEDAQIVAVGLDRHVTYHRLDAALANLNRGAAFVLANSDPTWPREKSVSLGTGAIA